ncbi:MAG: HAD hydrolase-like protein [Clostridia bacterium]|nr:HAD hydrolase-like protein [Clostridia bacterium]
MEKYIVWDVDGTVVDTRQAVADSYLYACEQVGIEETDGTRIFTYVGRRSTLIFSEYHKLEGERLQKAYDAYAEYFNTTGIEKAALYPGMAELFRELKANGAKMTVASARSLSQLTMLFERLNFSDAFDLIRATETNHKAADKPQLVRECIAFMGVKPEECVMIGDRIYDIAGGQTAGTRSIGVTFGFGTREELVECAPDAIVDDVAALRALLLGA